jgi:hypothetical protein
MTFLGLTGPFTVLPEPGQPRALSGSHGHEDALASPDYNHDAHANRATVTHFAPQQLRPELEHSTKVFPLAFSLFETFLGSKFPYEHFHQVSASRAQ